MYYADYISRKEVIIIHIKDTKTNDDGASDSPMSSFDLRQANSSTGIEYNKHFTIIPRIIVSGNYPRNLLRGHELKRLLHLYYTKNNKSGTSIAGRNSYRKYSGFIYPSLFDKVNHYLEDNLFSELISKKATLSSYRVNIPPLYDRINERTINYTGADMRGKNLYKYKSSFIMLPKDLIERVGILGRTFSTNEIMLILKLYRYNSLVTLGGVDPAIIHLDNGDLKVAERLYEDIYLTKEELVTTLECLEAKGLYKWVEIVVSMQFLEFENICRYVADKEMIKTLESNQRTISVIRLNHQIITS
ncbi:MAG TPA: hypothetical protein VEF53_10075 [Patescibacteria group bacterium]|nr:hypothetical protein [Patescibacteria group bacterium]